MRLILLILAMLVTVVGTSQKLVQGTVINDQTQEPISGASVTLKDSTGGIFCDENGRFSLQIENGARLIISATGFEPVEILIGSKQNLQIRLTQIDKEMDAVVVSGTLRPVKKLESPVPVEVYTTQFLKKNPTPSIFEALQTVNGVRPQLNCNVCNTGDIHINGLEGPYTMVTIDGMPIVSSLASVYGLFGIPSQLIDRIEIVKGPASGLFGSEAIGGLINIITKSPDKAPVLTANYLLTSWKEHNIDLGAKLKLGRRSSALIGVNYFNYQDPKDNNKDHFTDVTLQHRISIFNKVSFARKNNRVATIAGRFFYEDRWGGEMNYSKKFRGGDSVYGESIYTGRWELIGNYQLPVKEKIYFSFSATHHDQNSYYGVIPYMGKQKIAFGQLLWDKKAGTSHQLLTGLVSRYNYYDDNSTATMDTLSGMNKPDNYVVPGVFFQDEWKISDKHTVLSGLRFDYHPIHKMIFTPRFAWKWNLKEREALRLNAGTGFRVVSLFTEEHAALTGARAVEIKESLDPERSVNVNLNYTNYFRWENFSLNIDAAAWYSRFSNQIIPDYDTDPNKIIYKNLDGFSASKGFSLNLEMNKGNRFKSLVGVTIQDVSKTETKANGDRSKQRPVLTEKWSGTWTLTYIVPGIGLTIDYTGNIYGPMRLPLLSPNDPRPGQSPVWSIQNIQFSKLLGTKLECYAGVKNLLNWTPAKSTPFLIARSHDPFDKKVEYDPSGNVKLTPENPYGLTFDPAYMYAPNQGLRVFAGIRYTLKH